jgi:tetratricopeptide (TPR) repeat protein
MLRAMFFFALVAGFASPFYAQTPSPPMADTSQEAFVFDRIENLVRFEDDGTGIRDTAAAIHIQSDAGVQEFGQLIFGYSQDTEKLEIQYVRVRKPDGKVIETPLTGAQDFAPEILKEAPMYSDYRQRHVSVSSLQPGDVLEYRTIVHVTTALAPHQFWYEYSFPKEVVIHQDRLEVNLPKGREIKLKSPKTKYDRQEQGDRQIYTWEIKDFTPDRKRDRDEDFDESDLLPDVQMSSFTDWQQIARWYSQLQGSQAVDDDAVRQKAAEITRGATTPADKAHRLYDFVAQNIRYVSLSFGVGRLQPHAAPEVLANGYGDCKDKHTLLQALLHAEGISSYPVLINSARKIDPDIPSPAQFDHEITAMSLGPELTWLDTTAEVAPYGLILYQLRNKQALLASDDAHGGLVRSPAETPVKNFFHIKMDGKFTETGGLETNVEVTAQGDSDIFLRLAFRRVPQPQWQDLLQNLSRSWGVPGDVSEVHLDALNDTSKPLHLNYHLREDNYFRVPSSSTDFRLLPPIALSAARVDKKKPAEPVDVGPAVERTYRAHIQVPANYTVRVPGAIKMMRDYGEYWSTYSLNKDVLDAERHLLLKVDQLPASRRFDYESFRNASGNETQQLLSCSIAAPSVRHAAVVGAETSPAELQKLGVAALERRDFFTSADLLKRAVTAETDRKDAWDQLGQAYAGMNRHDDAVSAFRKQIDLDPNHKSANKDLAAELQKLGKLDDAVAAYHKQLEIAPDDKQAHTSLGLLFVQMKRDSDARAELEAAAAIPPDDPQTNLALAQVYQRTGETAKAAALLGSLTGSSTPMAGSDVFAAALREDINPEQTLREAQDTLFQIGDQFESGEYDKLTPSAFSAMNLVALAWSRIGWAKFLQGDNLGSMQYLNAAWLLSQSGTVANRLGRAFEKAGQPEKALHMFSLAAATGGSEAKSSREAAEKLSPGTGDERFSAAEAELAQMRTVQLPTLSGLTGTAQFALVFDSSSKPAQAEYLEGDQALQAAGDKLRETAFPVRFPDVSSVKILRRGTLSCDGKTCSIALQPLENLQTTPSPDSAAAQQH